MLKLWFLGSLKLALIYPCIIKGFFEVQLSLDRFGGYSKYVMPVQGMMFPSLL